MQAIRKNWVFLTIIFTIVICLLSAASNQYFVDCINSDYLYLHETANTLHGFKSMAGQSFPPAPYYFPDLLVIFLLQFLTINMTVINLISSFLFLLSYCILVFYLLQTVMHDKWFAYLGTLIAFCSYFLLIPNELQYLKVWPASHLSVILYCIFLLTVYLNIRDKRANPLLLLSLLIPTFLIFISDNLLFAQGLFPLSLAILIDRYRHPGNRKIAFYFVLIFFFVTLLGARMDLFLYHYFDITYALNASLFRVRKVAEIGTTLQTAWQIVKDNVSLNPIFYGMLLFYNLSSMLLVSIIFTKRIVWKISQESLNKLIFVLGYSYLAQTINIILAILCGKFTDVGRFRYLDTLHVFPSIAFAMTIVFLLCHRKFVHACLIVLSMTFIVSSFIFIVQNKNLLMRFSLQTPYPEFVQCIDRMHNTYAINNGVGEYWDVKEIRMLSKNAMMMTQVDKTLNFFNFIDNKHAFYKDSSAKTPFDYQFIIVTPDSEFRSLDKNKILADIGKPDRIEKCGYREVWVYLTAESRGKLNGYFREQRILECL